MRKACADDLSEFITAVKEDTEEAVGLVQKQVHNLADQVQQLAIIEDSNSDDVATTDVDIGTSNPSKLSL